MTKQSKKEFKRHFTFKPWYFLIIAVLFSIICVGALRNNNITALKLRNVVLEADKQNGDTEGALRNLREYVYSHMNTNLASGSSSIKPPIQLKYQYERLAKAEKDRVSALNARLYTEAQTECERRFPSGLSGSGRIPCIQEYVTSHGGATEQPIPDSLYKFDFVSPFWSPDLAGWSMLISVGSFMLFGVFYGIEKWVKFDLIDSV